MKWKNDLAYLVATAGNQAAVAELLGTTQAAVSNWMGGNEPSEMRRRYIRHIVDAAQFQARYIDYWLTVQTSQIITVAHETFDMMAEPGEPSQKKYYRYPIQIPAERVIFPVEVVREHLGWHWFERGGGFGWWKVEENRENLLIHTVIGKSGKWAVELPDIIRAGYVVSNRGWR